MIAWSLFLLGLLGSFTSLAGEAVAAMWVAAGWRGSALLRTGLGLRAAGCTAAGTGRGGGLMECGCLWVARTIRSRCGVFALSLGRLRRRCVVTRACRRLR